MRSAPSAGSRRLVFAAALLLLAAAPREAAARVEYPFCSVTRGHEMSSENCSFSSLEACREDIKGMGGFCSRNPYYVAPDPGRAPRASHKRRAPRGGSAS